MKDLKKLMKLIDYNKMRTKANLYTKRGSLFCPFIKVRKILSFQSKMNTCNSLCGVIYNRSFNTGRCPCHELTDEEVKTKFWGLMNEVHKREIKK